MTKKKKVFTYFFALVIVLITVLLVWQISQPVSAESTSAYELKVTKSGYYTIYVTGEEVELISSNSSSDIYYVAKNTDIILNVVNELKIFTKWKIKDSNGNDHDKNWSTEKKLKLTVENDLEISCLYRDPVLSDFGFVMSNRFIISSSFELIALQKIISSGGTIDADIISQYDILFDSFEEYKSASDKESYIKTNDLYNRVCQGYYLVENNISIFSSDFTGIGTKTHPFNGVFCGNNNGNISHIVMLINPTVLSNTDLYFGLFAYLGENAIVRNLKVNGSIGISNSYETSTSNNTIYAGVLAGYAKEALIYNVNVSSAIAISSEKDEICCGNVIGCIDDFGISALNKLQTNLEKSSIVINSPYSINCGLITGKIINTNNVYDTYFKDLTINASNFSTSIQGESKSFPSISLKMGILCGSVENAQTKIDNITIANENGFNLYANILSGSAYVGGLIGYIDASKKVFLGKVEFQGDASSEGTIKTVSSNSSSKANIYSGGLIGYIEGDNLVALDSFKKGIEKQTIDTKEVYQYNAIFQGNYVIKATQNGLADSNMTFGKCVASGLIARGFIDLNGLDNELAEVVIIKDGSLTIKAVQSSIASHESYSNNSTADVSNSDKEHCVASLFTGLVTNGYANKEYKNINFYAENVDLSATREMSSKAMGDISVGMLMAYSNGITYGNINMYINNSHLTCNSLSYEVKNTASNTNNSFVGGAIGMFDSNDSNPKSCTALSIKGYDWTNNSETGNTLEITSIQNTKAGGGDYKGENYVGGLIGELHNGSLEDSNFIGTEGISSITMRAHEDPDSAFCGGLIGFIKINNTNKITIKNNKIKNTDIYGEETVNIIYDNPDIYVGGVTGAVYIHDASGIIDFEDNKVYNCSIMAIGFERTDVYAGGINGTITWGSGTVSFKGNYVYDCEIKAEVSTEGSNDEKMQSYAAGICSFLRSNIFTIENNMVIDTSITSNAVKVANTYGLFFHERGTIQANNNYSNAELSCFSKQSAANIYGISNTITSGDNNYYLSNKKHGDVGIQLLIPDSKEIISTESDVSLDSINSSYTISEDIKKNIKNYHLLLQENDTSFEIANNYKIKATQTTEYAWDKAEIWVNAKEQEFDDELTEEELHDKGWYRLDIVNIYINSSEISSETNIIITDMNISYVDETREYVQSDNKYKNQLFPYDTIDDVNYDADNNNTIIANLYQDILDLKLTFTSNINGYLEFYSGNDKLSSSSNTIDDYGTYKVVKENVNDNYKYQIIFDFNTEITEDKEIEVKLCYGDKNEKICIISLVHNARKLVGATYASYTPPLNYHTEDANKIEEPYFKLKKGEKDNPVITKIIPIYVYSNDPNQTKIIDENNCKYVDYSVDGFSIEANGSLDSGNVVKIDNKLTITDKDDEEQNVTITFDIVEYYDVTYNCSNMEFEGLNGSLQSDDTYEFKLTIDDGYCGEFDELKIIIDNKEYDLMDKKPEGITVEGANEENGKYTFAYDTKEYTIIIDKDLLKGNISITADTSRLFTITFDLQNVGVEGIDNQKTYQIKGDGTKLKDYFENKTSEINNWTKDATRYGYLFNGFYNIDYASTKVSYSSSFTDLMKDDNIEVSVDMNFYARWSFLIELIEAPGTHIESSFSSSFMQEYTDSDTNKTVEIPINMHDGFVFTIIKDSNYIGESDVKAYIISHEDKNDVDIISNITVEKYYENMNLYYIPPESITGYLVIETFVSNSDFIVGENTAVVSDSIVPEDGVYTYKYVVNHRNVDNNKSYIYDEENLSKEKIFGLKVYNESGYMLPINTEVEVYYQKVVNGSVSQKIVGNYTITDRKDIILLSNFTLLDKKTKTFKNENFSDFLGSYQTVSEVYYFVVTPPNGYTQYKEMQHITIEGGYVYFNNTNYEFIEGTKSSSREVVNFELSETIKNHFENESSKQSIDYITIPSRVTKLESINDEYTFTDNKYFDAISLDITKGLAENGIITLNELGTLISKSVNIDIDKLSLYMDLNDSSVTIYGAKEYGAKEENSFETIKQITPTNVSYDWYEIDLSNYKYFMISNNSNKDVKISKIKIISNERELEYDNFNSDNNTITLKQEVINDTRHDGKHFILAVQFKENESFIVDIDSTIKLKVDDKEYEPIITNVKGQVAVFFDLSKITNDNSLDEFNFKIVCNNKTIYAVQLLEAENNRKPAMGEVRYQNLFKE